MSKEEFEKMWNQVEHIGSLMNLDYGEMCTIGGIFGQMKSELERLHDVEEQNKELKSLVLWSARRLPKTYKGYVYDGYKELTGEEPERL